MVRCRRCGRSVGRWGKGASLVAAILPKKSWRWEGLKKGWFGDLSRIDIYLLETKASGETCVRWWSRSGGGGGVVV